MVCTLCLARLLCPRRELRLKSSARWLTQIELHAEPVADFPREGETEAAVAGADAFERSKVTPAASASARRLSTTVRTTPFKSTVSRGVASVIPRRRMTAE